MALTWGAGGALARIGQVFARVRTGRRPRAPGRTAHNSRPVVPCWGAGVAGTDGAGPRGGGEAETRRGPVQALSRHVAVRLVPAWCGDGRGSESPRVCSRPERARFVPDRRPRGAIKSPCGKGSWARRAAPRAYGQCGAPAVPRRPAPSSGASPIGLAGGTTDQVVNAGEARSAPARARPAHGERPAASRCRPPTVSTRTRQRRLAGTGSAPSGTGGRSAGSSAGASARTPPRPQ